MGSVYTYIMYRLSVDQCRLTFPQRVPTPPTEKSPQLTNAD